MLKPIKSHNPLITLSYKSREKNLSYLHYHSAYGHQTRQASNIAFESRGLARSRDKLKILYFHYYIAYCQQTWQDDELPWGPPNHKVTWPFDCEVFQIWQGGNLPWGAPAYSVTWSLNHVALLGHVTSSILYTSTYARTVAIKHGKVMTHNEGLPLIHSCDPLNMRSRDKLKHISTIVMPMVTKLVRVVTNRQELPHINSNYPRWGGCVRWCEKLYTLYPQLYLLLECYCL